MYSDSYSYSYSYSYSCLICMCLYTCASYVYIYVYIYIYIYIYILHLYTTPMVPKRSLQNSGSGSPSRGLRAARIRHPCAVMFSSLHKGSNLGLATLNPD